MGKVEAIIKSEIVRLAKKEMRRVATPLRRDIRSLRSNVSQLRKTVLSLERFIALQKKEWEKKPPLKAAPEEVEASRLSPRLIRSLRKRLGLSQRDLARLTGVSSLTVYQWESGVFKPKKEKKGLLIALRKLGRREAKRLLEEKKAEETKKEVPSSKQKTKSG
ncbi:MAG: helix-turn-helix domain-containing protein, partial [Deltaproteobacteria bacterium]|nr:helix-turn-helix domain-containing protein [Deltaproteobacteria bacterium]